MTYIYDCEVTAYDWIVVFLNKQTKEFTVFHNDNDGVRNLLKDRPLLGGFNNKRYDQYILKAICEGYGPAFVKQVNDYIIGGGNGWECELVKDARLSAPQYDLMNDMQVGTSLKSIEAHLGMNIVESSVDFSIDHPLTESEAEEMITYCKYDLTATDRLDDLRRDYLLNKIEIGKACGISEAEALGYTNAKLTARYLGAKKRTFYDEREYKMPSCIKTEYIPVKVLEFFGRLADRTIPDDELWRGSYKFKIGDCKVSIGFGGIHGAIPQYKEVATDDREIRNADVGSYYPNEMRVNGLTSRAMANPQLYADTIDKRIAAKKSGDKATANALKLVLNTTYGAMLDKYNALYDPLMGRSVCISGQLQLLELTMHLVAECPSIKIIQLNTDGIMASFNKSDSAKWDAILDEWQERCKFTLEQENLKSIVQKDVNNYVEVKTDGSVKQKGGMLVRGVSTAGAFKINNNAVIVANALTTYLYADKPIADTIKACDTVGEFQLIAKCSHKYAGAFQDVAGEMIPVQRCNRVYAAKDTRLGTIYKLNPGTGTYEKIAGLPDHCIVDNDNHCTMDDIDVDWYIDLGEKQAEMFLGTPDIADIKNNILKIIGD